MTDPNPHNNEAAGATSSVGHQSAPSADQGTRTTGFDWLTYVLIATATCTVSGVVLVLWGDRQNLIWMIAVGAVSFTIATITWIGTFLFMSFKILKTVFPTLLRWLFRRRRSLL